MDRQTQFSGIARTRREAFVRGERTYFTGRPCIRGHVAARYVSTLLCVVCASDKNKANAARQNMYSKTWRKRQTDMRRAIEEHQNRNDLS